MIRLLITLLALMSGLVAGGEAVAQSPARAPCAIVAQAGRETAIAAPASVHPSGQILGGPSPMVPAFEPVLAFAPATRIGIDRSLT